MSKEVYNKLELEDKVLIEGRKIPLEVVELRKDSKILEGPNSGTYELYLSDNDDLLICGAGDREYSSYAEDLRKVGRWVKEEDGLWVHSKTGDKIELTRNEVGYWVIEVNEGDTIVDQPKYGFSDYEIAIDEINKLLKNNVEGF